MNKFDMLINCYKKFDIGKAVSFDEYMEYVIKYPDGMYELMFYMYLNNQDFSMLKIYFEHHEIYCAIKQAIIDNIRLYDNDLEHYVFKYDQFMKLIYEEKQKVKIKK